ncbi:MAG TPA: hypothetical protein VGL05_19430 [Kribbella sp.]
MTHSFKPITTEQGIQVAILDELQQIRRLLEPSKEPVDMEPAAAPVEDSPAAGEPEKKPAAKKAPAKKATTRKRVTGQ